MQPPLPTEDEIEFEVNTRTGIFSYFKISKVEFPKFFILGAMFGIISFIYSFMRILKDLFVMTRQDQNAIMFMKIFYVLPLSMGSVFFIQYLMATKTISRIFTIFILIFGAAFFSLGLIFIFEQKIMPSKFLFRDLFTDNKASLKGLNMFKYLFITANEPVATLIYLLAEIWGSLLMAYLYMSFLNESCTVKQFSRFLPPFYIIANLALLLSGLVSEKFREFRKNFSFEQNQILYSSVFLFIGFLSILLLFMKNYFETKILPFPVFIQKQQIKKKEKVKVGFTEGLSIMTKSKLLMSMSMMVFCYNVGFNMLESVYKAGIKAASKSLKFEIGDYSIKFNTYDQYIVSVMVIILNLSAFSEIIETYGWIKMGLITPFLMLIGSIILITAAIYNSSLEKLAFPWISNFFKGSNFIYNIENYGGMLFLAFFKIMKYSAFDICKEKMGIRIDPAHRARFKSVYDGIFNKLGKSIGSLYGLGVIVALDTDNVRKGAPFTLGILIVLIYIWIRSVVYLAGAYDQAIKTNTAVDIDLLKKEKLINE